MRRNTKLGHVLLCIPVVLICIIFLCQAMQIKGLEGNISRLEEQIDILTNGIEDVKGEMVVTFEDQQKQIDAQAEAISQTKQIVSTTNKAFTRFQNQQSKVEQELREELKKD